MANATAALQAAYNATSTIPILGTSVTEYGGALNRRISTEPSAAMFPEHPTLHH